VDALARMMAEGRSAISDITRFDTADLRAHKAALVEGFVAKNYIAPMKMRRMSGLSRLAVAAAKLAVDDAQIPLGELEPRQRGIAMGTTFGPVETSVEYLREYVEKGAALAPPQLFAESVANAPGSHVAIELGFQGFNVTFTQRESSAITALMHASSQILKGPERVVLAGGAEETHEIIYGVLDRIGALAHADAAGPEASRPFDRRRNGMVVGEGGCVLFVAEAAAVSTRTPYAWISGFGVSRDTTASISDWGDDAGAVARAMRDAIDDAGLRLSDIDAVWASANGSLEARALQQLFGASVPPVVAAKSYFGEYAAAGAIHLATAVLALREQLLPATLGYGAAEDGLELPIVTAARPAPIRHMLVNSLSAGGGTVCAVISRDDR
jgi:3-oxoacyl-[acyl-carrier-protein] synthase II